MNLLSKLLSLIRGEPDLPVQGHQGVYRKSVPATPVRSPSPTPITREEYRDINLGLAMPQKPKPYAMTGISESMGVGITGEAAICAMSGWALPFALSGSDPSGRLINYNTMTGEYVDSLSGMVIRPELLPAPPIHGTQQDLNPFFRGTTKRISH